MCKLYHLYSCTYVYTVPAKFKDPDILILDNANETTSGLIENDKIYNVTWNSDKLNQNDYNETGVFKFYVENWLFQVHPVTRVSRWFPRHEHPGITIRRQFRIIHFDSKNGLFSFKQVTKSFAAQFVISIIAVRKQTENLNITYTSSLLSFLHSTLGYLGRDAIKEFCHSWYTKTSEIVTAEDLTSCPCTLESAKMDPYLEVDFTCSATEPGCHENINAYRCFLKRIKNTYVFVYVYVSCINLCKYCIRGLFGGDFNLAVWQIFLVRQI